MLVESRTGLLLSLTPKSSLFQNPYRSENGSEKSKANLSSQGTLEIIFSRQDRQEQNGEWSTGHRIFSTLQVSWCQKLTVVPSLQEKFSPSQGQGQASTPWPSMAIALSLLWASSNELAQLHLLCKLRLCLGLVTKKLGSWGDINLCKIRTDAREWRTEVQCGPVVNS